MKTTRILCLFLLFASLLWLAPSAQPGRGAAHAGSRPAAPRNGRSATALRSSATGAFNYHSAAFADSEAPPSADTSGGIREEIPAKYGARYQRWKNEFLATATGRRQWAIYAQNSRLTLTITMSCENRHGASTGRYRWSETGELLGATITLGCEIDAEFPEPVYYPVMNSLGWSRALYMASGDMLAATKIAHEFGHVIRAENSDGNLYRLQNKLMPIYRTIFLNNGYNTHDPRLVDLAQQMGGTCVEVWEDREYWGEANAMLYLRDRVAEKNFRCYLFSRIRRTIDEYAENYAARFEQVAHSEPDLCGWQ
jgi:hypothetical protein